MFSYLPITKIRHVSIQCRCHSCITEERERPGVKGVVPTPVSRMKYESETTHPGFRHTSGSAGKGESCGPGRATGGTISGYGQGTQHPLHSPTLPVIPDHPGHLFVSRFRNRWSRRGTYTGPLLHPGPPASRVETNLFGLTNQKYTLEVGNLQRLVNLS